jgi:LacI family transcriptional regulator
LRISLLRNLGMPFIVHGRASAVNDPYSWLDVNNRRSFRRATEFLVDLGHRRIALLNGFEHLDFAIRRRDGYIAGLAGRGIQPDASLMFAQEMTEDYGYTATRRLLGAQEPPTAVLTSSMIVAIGVRRALYEAGLHLGRDVSLITHDDDLSYFRNGQDVPIFTALRSSVREAGRLAAEMLISSINAPELGPRTRLLEADLILGPSTGPCPR